ncbi:MAG TPA: response regulator transcription factor [Aquella sp.]|nr:response regulator transcription factor [Aquella sp.]
MLQTSVKIGLVDDHILVRDALANAIKSFDEFDVTLLAENGKDFISKLNHTNIPEILILDLNMPEMDGHETIYWLLKNHPEIKILVLSMYDAESLIHLIKVGVRGFVKKGAAPSELKHAIQSVLTTGTYCSTSVTSRLFGLMKDLGTKNSYWGTIILNECEIAFLKLVATELTYKEIAQKMKVSPRTVDNYRDALFLKLNVKSRVGLVVYAIKSGIVTLNF